MSGLLRRLRRARDNAPGDPAGDTAVLVEETERSPAGPDDLDTFVGNGPTTQRRSRLRRRLRHLRRVREVLLRDLGGFVLEVHKAGGRSAGAGVVDGKLARLAAVDTEIRQLESVLGDHRPLVVREAGIGGACPHCGEIFGSEARFCWACGNAVAAGAGAAPQLPVAAPAATQPPTPLPPAADPTTTEAPSPVPPSDQTATVEESQPHELTRRPS